MLNYLSTLKFLQTDKYENTVISIDNSYPWLKESDFEASPPCPPVRQALIAKHELKVKYEY